MSTPAEVSITRLANEETHPIRIAIAAVADPSCRLIVDLGLADFALALTGRGNVSAFIEKSTLDGNMRKAIDEAHALLDKYTQRRDVSHDSLKDRIRGVIGMPLLSRKLIVDALTRGLANTKAAAVDDSAFDDDVKVIEDALTEAREL